MKFWIVVYYSLPLRETIKFFDSEDSAWKYAQELANRGRDMIVSVGSCTLLEALNIMSHNIDVHGIHYDAPLNPVIKDGVR